MSVRKRTADGLFFPAWDEPREAEPAHGLFVRVSQMNGQPSTPQVAFQADIRGRYLDPQECLALMLRHPIEGAPALAENTPRPLGDGVALRGHPFRRGQWSTYYRRFCPACLGQSAHHRTWFDLTFVKVCPFHGVRLDGGRADARRVTWVSTDFLWAGGEYVPETALVAGDSPGSDFEAHALGRLGFAPARPAGMLDGHSLADVVEAVAAVGNLATVGARWDSKSKQERVDIAEAQALGFSLLQEGGPGLVEAVSRVRSARAEAADPRSGMGVTGLFGRAFRAFEVSANPILTQLAAAMVEAARMDGRVRRTPAIVARGWAPLGRMTLTEASRELDLTVNCVGRLSAIVVEEFDRSRIGWRVHLSPDDVAALREAAETALAASEVSERLGAGADEIRRLVASGHLRKIRGIDRRRPHVDLYLAKGVRDLEARLDDVPMLDSTVGSLVTPVVAARLRGTSVADLLHGMVLGDVVPAGRQPGEKGFASLRFAKPEGCEVTEKFGRGRWAIAREGLTFAEASARIGVQLSTLSKLVAAGHLCTIDPSDTGTGRRRVTEASVAAFVRKFVPSARLAAGLGCLPADAASALRKLGHRSLKLPKGGPRAEALFRRAKVRGFLERDAPASLERFLADGISKGGTTFHGHVPNGGGPLVVWSSNRRLKVEVEVREGTLEAALVADEKRSKVRHGVIAAAAPALCEAGFDIVAAGTSLAAVARLGSTSPEDPATWAAASGALVEALDRIRRALAVSKAAGAL